MQSEVQDNIALGVRKYKGGIYKNESSAVKYGDAEEIALEITLPDRGEELFAVIRLKKKQASPMVESGTLRLPLAGKIQRFLINKPGTLIDPETDIAENANHVFYAVDRRRLCLSFSIIWIRKGRRKRTDAAVQRSGGRCDGCYW